MSDSAEHGDRLEELEIRVAYQENQIEELNKALFEHWQLIETLSNKLRHLGNKVSAIDERVPSNPEDEPPPPHY